MAEHYKELDVGFSTADVSDISVTFADRTLTTSFANCRGEKTTVIFRNVAAYKWDDHSFTQIDAAPDRVYQVLDSEWLRAWPENFSLSHFMLGLCGNHGYAYLDVIAQNMEQKPPNQPPEPTPTAVTPPAGQEARQP